MSPYRSRTTTVYDVTCFRCEYQGTLLKLPLRCPRCKSPYWNKRRAAEVTVAGKRKGER